MRVQRGFGFYLGLMLLVMLFLSFARQSFMLGELCSYNEYVTAVDQGDVATATVTPNAETPTGKITISTKDGVEKQLYVTDVNREFNRLSEAGVIVNVNNVQKDNLFLIVVLPILAGMVIVAILVVMLNNQAMQGGGGNKMMNFGKSRARMADGSKLVTFKDVAGLKEEKEDLEEIVDFLKNISR